MFLHSAAVGGMPCSDAANCDRRFQGQHAAVVGVDALHCELMDAGCVYPLHAPSTLVRLHILSHTETLLTDMLSQVWGASSAFSASSNLLECLFNHYMSECETGECKYE